MNDTDPNGLKTLLDFLNRIGPEVSGHESPEPDAEAAKRLGRFTRGEADEAERLEICQLLHEHPTWLRWVAAQIKSARPGRFAKPATA